MIYEAGKYYFKTAKENNFICCFFRYNRQQEYQRPRGFYASFHVSEIEFLPEDEFLGKFGRLYTETYIPGDGFSVFLGEISRKSKKAEADAAALLRENLRAYLERMAARAGLELVQPVKIAEIR